MLKKLLLGLLSLLVLLAIGIALLIYWPGCGGDWWQRYHHGRMD